MERSLNSKQIKNLFFKGLFRLCGIVAGSMIILIVGFIFIKGVSVFLPSYGEGQLSFTKFISGMTWQAETGQYGVLFIIINTLVTSFFAILLSFPISVLTALFIVKIAPKWLSNMMQLVIELLAAIPSVVYGVFASGVIVMFVDSVAMALGFSTFGGRSMLSVVILLAMMILPTMTSLSITAIASVSKDLENASLALGASSTQTNFKVILSSAKSGIFAGLILGLSRALGEATAVSMVAGNRALGPTWNPFDITRTLTSTMLSGLSETTGADYDVRFSVGIVLIAMILISNIVIHAIKRKVGHHES